MNSDGYEIVEFRPDLLDGVLQVLSHLWGNDAESNRSYFQWKYSLNPYIQKELGIVALHENNVVGFRGYFATRWKLSETNKEIIILCPGDTCVDPNHRRKNLSVVMGAMAMETYAQRYRLFFNFSSSNQSTPGYVKMGFAPLTDKGYLNQYTLPGLIRYAMSFSQKKADDDISIQTGVFGDIEVLSHPKPDQMASLASLQRYAGRKIYLVQDKDFFQWRYNNKRKKYVFYFCKRENDIVGYMVIRVLPRNGRGFIVDYAARDEAAMTKIVSFPIKNKHFNVVSISTYSVADPVAAALKDLKFKRNSFLRIVEKKLEGEWPLLVRPVRKTLADQDYFIEGLDIRNFHNWSLKEICSDGS